MTEPTPGMPEAAPDIPPQPAAPDNGTTATAGTAFSATLRPPRFWRVGVVAAAGLVLLVSAALAIGASPNPTPDTGSKGPASGGWAPGLGSGPEAKDFDLRGPGMLGGRFGQITISAISGSSISLKTDDGWTRTIAVTDSTKITKGGQTVERSALKVGDQVRFSQTRNDDGSFTITAIEVVVPRVAGSVSAVSADGFTLKARDGTTWTVKVNGSTTYKLGSGNGSKSDIKTGVDVVVAGEQGTGNTLTALSVQIRVPVVFGEVTAKSGSTLTIQRPDGTKTTVHTSGSTTYKLPGVDTPGLSDVTVGMQVIVQGTQRSDGSIDAQTVAGGRLGHGMGDMAPFGRQLPRPNASTAPTTQG